MLRFISAWLFVFLLVGCQPAAQSATPAASPSAPATQSSTLHTLTIYGYNYTNRYIDQFDVNGQGGGNMDVSSATSSGGGGVCCMGWRDGTKLPLTFNVRWVAGGCTFLSPPNQFGERYRATKHFFKEQAVVFSGPVPTEPGYLEVHIYPDARVEIAITATRSEPRLKLDPARSVNPYPEKCKATEK